MPDDQPSSTAAAPNMGDFGSCKGQQHRLTNLHKQASIQSGFPAVSLQVLLQRVPNAQ